DLTLDADLLSLVQRLGDLRLVTLVPDPFRLDAVARRGRLDQLLVRRAPRLHDDGADLLRRRQRRLELDERLAPRELVDGLLDVHRGLEMQRARLRAAVRSGLFDEQVVPDAPRALHEKDDVVLVVLEEVRELLLRTLRIRIRLDLHAQPAADL